MRTPEEIHRYGKDVIEKHCNKLSSLNNGYYSEIIDENNQIFRMSDYRDWKYEVIDFIKNHDPERIDKIERLFQKFEILFTPGDLSEIIGILSSSINNLRRKENGEGTDNPQKAQTSYETEGQNLFKPGPVEENPQKKKKKDNNRIKWICIIVTIVSIIAAIYYYKIDIYSAAAIAAIISAIFAIFSFVFK